MSHGRNRLANGNLKIVAIAGGTQPAQKQTTQTHQGRSIFSTMNQFWQFFLAAASGEEVRIWQTSDNDGNTWWHGCDRVTGRSIDAATEGEMRAWIDRRYC
jgi:hypothetical protein